MSDSSDEDENENKSLVQTESMTQSAPITHDAVVEVGTET